LLTVVSLDYGSHQNIFIYYGCRISDFVDYKKILDSLSESHLYNFIYTSGFDLNINFKAASSAER
ncbi:hypothetical protein, partial [Ignavibacterium album]|uniref:hypothetical protein n=1 Tax=Ignavibacterium album TaxID=591197 RepID=UPI0038B410B0